MAVPTRAPERVEPPRARQDPPSRGGFPGSAGVLAALALACAYAAFAAGATHPAQGARLELGLAVLALAAVVSRAQGGTVAWRAGRAATAGVVLLAGLAGWEALTLLWSLTPDASWIAANRSIAYALVVALALAAGGSDPRAVERAVVLVLASCTLVALYAFAAKALPGVRVPLLFDLERANPVSRLGAPLGSPNALAIVCATGVPLAVGLACDLDRRRRDRALAIAAGLLLVCVLGLTYSRGGLLALAAGAVVLSVLASARLRGLVLLAGLSAASAPVLAVAFTRAGTSENGVALAQRSTDGRVVLGVFLLSLAVLLATAFALGRRGAQERRRLTWSRPRVRGLVVLATLGVLLGALALARSDGGLTGLISDRADAFTAAPTHDPLDPGHLLTTSSGNRWTWWEEAAGAWSDRPVQGWGAGSFGALHLRYRQDRLVATQAHSVGLQALAETGVVGLVLLAGAVGLLGVAAVVRLRGSSPGRERDLAAAALAGVAAWLAHGTVESDWSVPGATLPALVLLGVLASSGGRARVAQRGGGAAALVIVPAALLLSLVAVSSLLPAWADGKAKAAQQSGLRGGATDAQVLRAAAGADVAARLDPLAVRPLLASAAIARRRGRLLEARGYLLRAVARQPASAEAWLGLAGAAFELADRAGFERAALRALELDPLDARTREVARSAVANRTPPGASATAVGTPLTPAPVPAPAAPPTGATGATGATGPAG